MSSQPSLFGSMITPEKREQLLCETARWVCQDLRPLSIVSGAGFKRLMGVAVPGWEVPHRDTIRDRVERLHTHVKSVIKAKLEKAPGVAICLDGWTSSAGKHYVGYTFHIMNSDFGCESFAWGVLAARGTAFAAPAAPR